MQDVLACVFFLGEIVNVWWELCLLPSSVSILFQSKSASFSRVFRWLLWLEIVMYTSFYTMLEDGYKLLRSFWIKQHWTQACSYRGRLKSRWREDLFQSKLASFWRMFRWLLWLEVVMYTSFYTMLEDGYKILRSFWIKQHWTQACSYRGRLKSLWRENLFQSKSASFSRMFRWLLWLEVFMYTSFYTMLEDGYKLLWSFWIKQHWTQACSHRGRLKSRWREDLFQSKSASFSRMFRWLLWLEVFMYTSFYTMLEDGYKLLWSFWIKQHWTQACSYRGRLKSLWREDLFQSKSASFSRMFRWLLWLEIVMYTSFYTMLEDGCKILRSFWIKQHWTQACSYRGTAFRWAHQLKTFVSENWFCS